MSTLYPGAMDDTTTLPPPGPNTVTNVGTNSITHAGLHDNEILAIQALETKLGTGSSTATANTVLRGTGSGTTAFGQVAVSTDISGLGTGVATFLGTPSSANLAAAVTNETGTGALVFANSPALVTPTGIVKSDVGLGNVDNTSDATKNAASVALTNHTIDASLNTLSNIPVSAIATSSGAWTTYTPTFTSISGGTLNYAKYSQIGKTVTVRFKYTFAGAGMGTGPTMTLPVTAASDLGENDTGAIMMYSLALIDAGNTYYVGGINQKSTTTVVFRRLDVTGSGNLVGITATSPFTWGNTDFIQGWLMYEAA